MVIGGLAPLTTYYFQTRSGSLIDNNGGAFYTVTTGPDWIQVPSSHFVYGYVYESNGTTPVPNAVVYLQVQDANGGGSPGNSQWVTARTDATGGWFFRDLGNIRTADTNFSFTFSDGADHLRLMAQGGDRGVAGWVTSGWSFGYAAGIAARLEPVNKPVHKTKRAPGASTWRVRL